MIEAVGLGGRGGPVRRGGESRRTPSELGFQGGGVAGRAPYPVLPLPPEEVGSRTGQGRGLWLSGLTHAASLCPLCAGCG